MWIKLRLKCDSNNTIYLSDTSNHRVRKISPNGIISTIAGIQGGGGYTGDNIKATNTQLYNPRGIYVTTSNMVYIADTNNHRIRMISGIMKYSIQIIYIICNELYII
jgi:sugar lactone lactonase YvrE